MIGWLLFNAKYKVSMDVCFQVNLDIIQNRVILSMNEKL